jgi:hypothetical protein
MSIREARGKKPPISDTPIVYRDSQRVVRRGKSLS